MNDEELIARLEDRSLSPDCFHHPEHLRAAFLYLRRYPAPEALSRFSEALRSFAAAMGKAERYHETITWAYLFLVRQRMTGAQTWEEFAAGNADLLEWKDSILKSYYRDETLASEKARRVFVLPDRLG